MTVELTPEFFIKQRRHSGWSDHVLPESEGCHFTTARIGAHIQVTQSHCNRSATFTSHIEHPEPTTLIIYGVRGISHFQLGRQNCLIRPGDLWVMHTADLPLTRHTPPDQHCSMQVLKCVSQRLCEETDRIFQRPVSRRLMHQAQQPEPLRSLMSNQLHTPFARLMAESQALALLAPSLDDSHQPSASSCPKSVQRAMELMTVNLCSPPSLAALARETGMTHTRLTREFRKYCGTTVFGWLRQYRMEIAERQLRHSRLDITEIALSLGYSSASHFASSFRQQHKCTPQEYRSRME